MCRQTFIDSQRLNRAGQRDDPLHQGVSECVPRQNSGTTPERVRGGNSRIHQWENRFGNLTAAPGCRVRCGQEAPWRFGGPNIPMVFGRSPSHNLPDVDVPIPMDRRWPESSLVRSPDGTTRQSRPQPAGRKSPPEPAHRNARHGYPRCSPGRSIRNDRQLSAIPSGRIRRGLDTWRRQDVQRRVGEEGTGNQGTAEMVKNTPGAISYNEWSFAIDQGLSTADIQTPAGSPTLVPIGSGPPSNP